VTAVGTEQLKHVWFIVTPPPTVVKEAAHPQSAAVGIQKYQRFATSLSRR